MLSAQAEGLLGFVEGEMTRRRRAQGAALRAGARRVRPSGHPVGVPWHRAFAQVELVRTHLAAQDGLNWPPLSLEPPGEIPRRSCPCSSGSS